MWEEVLRWVLPLLDTVTIDGRRIMPRLKLCPAEGCPRFYLEEHGKGACSVRCAQRVRFKRYIENLKKSPPAYDRYLRKKQKRRRSSRL